MNPISQRSFLLRALYAKELRSYFDTPAAYVVTVVLLLISGYLFASPLFLQNQAVLSGFVDVAPLLLLFFVPAVTMRLYAEEYKSGTIEILATLPVTDIETLLAKYLASMTIMIFMLAGTSAYAATICFLGNPDWGRILGSYAGLSGTCAVLAAVGLWASSLTRNQIVAFIIAFLISFALYLLGKIYLFIHPALASLTNFIGLDSHLDNMARGVWDTRDLLYYASLSGFFLYLTYLNVSTRRLRG